MVARGEKTSDLREASCLFPQSTVIWPPFQPYQVRPSPAHIFIRRQSPGQTAKGLEAYHPPLLDRYAAKKNMKRTFLIPFPSSSCSSSNPLPWKATGRVIERQTLHIESRLPPWRGHLGPKSECLTKTNKHKIAGVGGRGPLSDCFFHTFISLQVKESSEAGLILCCFGDALWVFSAWRALNNLGTVSKYLHSILSLGRICWAESSWDTFPLSLVRSCWAVKQFHFLHLVADGCSFSLVTALLPNGTHGALPWSVCLPSLLKPKGLTAWINKACVPPASHLVLSGVSPLFLASPLFLRPK